MITFCARSPLVPEVWAFAWLAPLIVAAKTITSRITNAIRDDTCKQTMDPSITLIPPESHGKIRREGPHHPRRRSSSER
jgi:hypothetical protein